MRMKQICLTFLKYEIIFNKKKMIHFDCVVFIVIYRLFGLICCDLSENKHPGNSCSN